MGGLLEGNWGGGKYLDSHIEEELKDGKGKPHWRRNAFDSEDAESEQNYPQIFYLMLPPHTLPPQRPGLGLFLQEAEDTDGCRGDNPPPPAHRCLFVGPVRVCCGRGRKPRQEPTMPRKRCARPTKLPSSEKKTRREIIDKRVAYTRIYLGNQIGRWLTLREKLDFKSDTDLAGFLLDLYDNDDQLPKEAVIFLPEDMRIVTAKEERDLHDDSSSAEIVGICDSEDQLTAESACSVPQSRGIRTVKEERQLQDDSSSVQSDEK
ncbi:unnamed protein product [Caretta caretta]